SATPAIDTATSPLSRAMVTAASTMTCRASFGFGPRRTLGEAPHNVARARPISSPDLSLLAMTHIIASHGRNNMGMAEPNQRFVREHHDQQRDAPPTPRQPGSGPVAGEGAGAQPPELRARLRPQGFLPLHLQAS